VAPHLTRLSWTGLPTREAPQLPRGNEERWNGGCPLATGAQVGVNAAGAFRALGISPKVTLAVLSRAGGNDRWGTRADGGGACLAIGEEGSAPAEGTPRFEHVSSSINARAMVITDPGRVAQAICARCMVACWPRTSPNA
jgi:hypothetical protein